MAGVSIPPLIRCHGIRQPAAKAVNGIYEFQGVVDSRPCYHQTGVSSGNHLWFVDESAEGPLWVVTPKDAGVGGGFDSAIAKCSSSAWWPWDTENWQVCGKHCRFSSAPGMRFDLLTPAAELRAELRLPLLSRAAGTEVVVCTFRGAAAIHGRPAYKQVGGNLRLFWMPRMARWLLAAVKEDEAAGIQYVAARSRADDGSTWSSLWPWEHQSWEMPSAVTHGIEDGEATWSVADGRVAIQMTGPPVTIAGDPETVPRSLVGLYMPQGMVHGRPYYVQRLEDISLENSVGPKCLWFAEDRGQWVLTDPTGLGNSTVVLARIATRAWWPWEAHLGGNTSPAALGSAPFACLPEWHGGAAVLAAARAGWDVADPGGTFHKARDMKVTMVCIKSLVVKAHHMAMHPFLGPYEYAGLLSSRPFFMQQIKEEKAVEKEEAPDFRGHHANIQHVHGGTKDQRFAIWYAEELEQWVITEDFRLLDFITVDARVSDTAWFPWEAERNWEISDKVGGYCKDPAFKIEAAA